jgi:homoserine kinase
VIEAEESKTLAAHRPAGAMRLRVRVPASSANLGPGFDCLGLALGLFNEVIVDLSAAPGVRYLGRDAEVLAGQENLVQTAMGVFQRATGARLPTHGLTLLNKIPTTRGLGSSAAAIVAGLMAANALAGSPLMLADLMHLGSEMEGHGDNIGAALYGGLVVSVVDGGRYTAIPVPVGDDLRAVVYVPENLLSTAQARAVLPRTLSMADAVHNIGRAALLTVALQQGRYEYLATGMDDRLHQPYRAPLVDGLVELMRAARAAGAYGACLSGAGPSLLALADPDQAVVVAAALARAAHERNGSGEVLQLDICRARAQASWEDDRDQSGERSAD